MSEERQHATLILADLTGETRPTGDNDRSISSSRKGNGIRFAEGGRLRAILPELERERSRIARELHAGAGQPLACMRLSLEVLDRYTDGLPPAALEAVARLRALSDQALQQVRACAHALHPPEWQNLSLREALLGLVSTSGLADMLHGTVDIRQLEAEPSHAVKTAIYRCAQECISNTARHSGASRFTLSLLELGEAIEFRFEDNGRGFTAGNTEQTGIGLRAIREHAEDLGGDCIITGGPDGVKVGMRFHAGAE